MDLPDDWTTETVRANGVDLQCYRTGEGDPVVLAHGFYDDGRCWVPLAADLAEDHEVVAYDARGHGRSDAPEDGYGIDDRVADLAGVADAFEFEEPVLLGHSMGAGTVAWAAARRPELPRAVVLEDPVGLDSTPDAGPEERARMTLERLEAAADESEASMAQAAIDDGIDPEWARRSAAASHRADRAVVGVAREGYPGPMVDAFPEIECPTLVLKSDGDRHRRVRDLAAAEELPTGRMVHVPRAGHYVFGTEYEAAHAELRAFLARV